LFDCPALSRHRQDAAGDVLEEVRSLLPAWDEWKGDGSFEDKFTAHGYFLTFPTELVLLVGKVMRRDENDDKKQEQLLDDTDVIRACFGGFLTWELKAVLRRVAGIGRDSSGRGPSLDIELAKQIDLRVDLTIGRIRKILFDAAFEASMHWFRP